MVRINCSSSYSKILILFLSTADLVLGFYACNSVRRVGQKQLYAVILPQTTLITEHIVQSVHSANSIRLNNLIGLFGDTYKELIDRSNRISLFSTMFENW